MLTFEPLASSSAGCSYRLSGGGASAPILIDAGLRFELLRRALDFQVTSLAGCLISHAHGDHCAAVPKLLGAGVECYASAETWARITCEARHRAKSVKSLEQFGVGDWQVMAFDAVHDLPGTYGFIVGSPDGSKLLYLTDSAYSKYTFSGLTHIAIECNWNSETIRENVATGLIDKNRFKRTISTHMGLPQLLEMLKANDLSKVEEIHLLHLSDDNSDEAGFKSAVERLTGCPVYVAAKSGSRS